jgi:hypothetical protein
MPAPPRTPRASEAQRRVMETLREFSRCWTSIVYEDLRTLNPALGDCHAAGWVRCIPHPYGKDWPEWELTDAGRAVLAEERGE